MSPFNINFNNKKAHVNAADRPAFIEDFHKKYVEEEKAKEAANPTSDNHKKLLDSLEDATSKARLRKREREATRTRAYNTLLNSLKTRDDFDELSAMGQRKAANGLFDRTNMTGKSAEEQGVVKETRDDAFHQNIYDYMTPEQKSMYYAFLGLGDQQSAKRYLASIEEGLQQQAADKMLQTIQPGNIENVQDFADVTRLGVRSGIGRFETGVQQLTNPNAVSKNYTETAFEEARKDMSGATGVVADLANTVGFMLLPAGGSMVLGLAGGAGLAASKAASYGIKALSASLFGAAAGGSTYNDMLKENPGADKFDAKVYSIINGALEGSLQYLLGGIGKLGVGGITKATGKSISGAVAKKLMNVSKAASNTPAVKALIKALVGGGKWAAGASDEALEEWLQAVLDPVMRNLVLGENNEVKLFGEDQLYAAFLGALGATVMNAPGNISDTVNAQQVLEETVAKQETKAAERANKNKPAASTETPEVPEVTPEQIEAHMDDKKVANLVKQINRLEQKIATDTKKYHHNKPNGGASLESNLEKAQTALAKRVAELEKEAAASTENAAGIPGPPPAPVGNEGLGLINSALGEEIEGLDNYNRTRQGTSGRDLINAGIRNGAEGEISPQTNLARPSGERQAAPTRGITPGQTRRQNIQNRVAQQTEGIPFSESLGDRVGGGEVTSQESMVQWFRDSLASAYEQLQEGSQMLEPVHSAVYDTMEQFRNYARNVLGWSEEQIELEIASWNVPEYFTTPPEVTRGHAQATNLMRKARGEAKASGQQGQQLQEQSIEEGPAPWEEQQQVTDEDINKVLEQEEQPEQVTDEDIDELITGTKTEIEQSKAELEQSKAALEQTKAALEQAKTALAQEELKEKYINDIQKAKKYHKTSKKSKGFSNKDYNSYITNLNKMFYANAIKLGMSEAEIEAVISGEEFADSPTSSEENVVSSPTKTVTGEVAEEVTEEVTDEDIEEVIGSMEDQEEPEDFPEPIQNEELTTNEDIDEINTLLNQRDAEREAAGEAVGAITKPEVTITGGNIEVRFPKWPGRDVTSKLSKNGFKWDKDEGIWWGGENNTNRALVEELTGVKLTEEEFEPTYKRISKEELDNGRTEQSGRIDNEVDAGRDNVYNDERRVGAAGQTDDSRRDRRNELRKTGVYALAAEREARKRQILNGNRPTVDGSKISKELPKNMVIIDQNIIDELDLHAPEWNSFRLALEDVKNGAFPEDYDVVFYASDDVKASPGLTIKSKNKVYVNVTGVSWGSLYQTVCHERFHAWVGKYGSRFKQSVREGLRKAGLSDDAFDVLVADLAQKRWEKAYKGQKAFNSDGSPSAFYYRFEEEVLANLAARSQWVFDYTEDPESFRTYFDNEQEYNAFIDYANKLITVSKAVSTHNQRVINKITEGTGLEKYFDATEDAITQYATNHNSRRKSKSPSPTEIIQRLQEQEPYQSEDAFLSPSIATSSTFTENQSGNVPAENVIDELKPIYSAVPQKVRDYIVQHQSDINAEAWKNIVKKGGVDTVAGSLLKTSRWNPLQLEMAVEISKCFAVNGEYDRAAEVTTKILGQQREFGRAIKYLETLQQYMPNAVTAVGHSLANEIDVELSAEEEADLKLCDEILEDGFISQSVIDSASPEFKDWLEKARGYLDVGTIDATTAAYGAASRIVMAHDEATFRDKFRALQRISLLSNVKTHGRNILGNAAEVAGSVMSRPVGMLADKIIGKSTGERTYGSGGGKAFVQSIAPGVEQAIMDHKLGLNTVGNKFDEGSSRNGVKGLAQQKAFNEKTDSAIHNTVSKTLNNIDELIGLGLSIGDAPFLLGHYNDALAQLMSNRPDLTEPTLEMIDTAWDVAYRRTFRDDNAVTKALSSIRNSLPGIGETIAPYVQTPVNVVLTAIEYSPIGFMEAIGKIAFGKNSLTSLKQRGESTMKVQRQIADLFGRGAVGTAFMLLGAMMKAAGRITDDDDDIDSQKEKNWNTATGRRGSSIKFGDKYVDPSSMQSLSTPLMAGAAAYDSDEGGTDWGGILGAAVKASMKMGNTMLEMPVLQGVADLFSGNYDDGEIIAGLLGLAGNAVTQVVPFGSAMRQVAKTADPYSRVQSEINEGPFNRIIKNTANNLKAMVPGVRETLPERTDVLGNPIKNDASRNVAERVYNSLFNPFNTSREVKNDVTDEIDRLFDELKDTEVLPPAAGNRISYGGEVYKFTSAEKQAYQRVEGETNTEIISSLVNSDAYNQLSSEDQAKVIESGYKYAANKAKADYLEKKGIEYTSDETWMDKIDAVVEAGVDIGSALVYRYEINQINGADDQAHYLMQQSISADQKKILDTQFVDKFGFHPIEDDHDYTSEDTLALSMTSDSGRGKYDRVFSGDWTAPSGNSYRALSGVEFGELYDACYFKNSPTKAESIESIRKMLMEKWGLDGYAAEALATDFRAVMGSKKY